MDKLLYKAEIITLKIIPYALAFGHFLNDCLLLLGLPVPVLASFTSVSYIVLIFLYLSSYAFKFCEYHRLPLHYILCNKLLNSTEFIFNFNVSDYNFLIVHVLLFGTFTIGSGIMKTFSKKEEK